MQCGVVEAKVEKRIVSKNSVRDETEEGPAVENARDASRSGVYVRRGDAASAVSERELGLVPGKCREADGNMFETTPDIVIISCPVRRRAHGTHMEASKAETAAVTKESQGVVEFFFNPC